MIIDFSQKRLSVETEQAMYGRVLLDGVEINLVWYIDTELGILRTYDIFRNGKYQSLRSTSAEDLKGKCISAPRGELLSEELRGKVELFHRWKPGDMIDILYLAKGRPEFTAVSIRALRENTDWSRVRSVFVYDDGSGARHGMPLSPFPVRTVFCGELFGGPVAIMNHFLQRPGESWFAKIDNDAMVPPRWLNLCLAVLDEHRAVDLLGIEPPSSTVRLDLSKSRGLYAETDAIGGIGLMWRAAFAGRPMRPHSVYGGFTDWQLAHPEVKKGWMAPPIDLFLLDRLPVEPWASLSKQYIAAGEQRAWKNYGPEDWYLWSWWDGK